MLLDADERNFHAWTYRRFLCTLQGTPADEELAFSSTKIGQNFSNYSAWHYRTRQAYPRMEGAGRLHRSQALTPAFQSEKL